MTGLEALAPARHVDGTADTASGRHAECRQPLQAVGGMFCPTCADGLCCSACVFQSGEPGQQGPTHHMSLHNGAPEPAPAGRPLSCQSLCEVCGV